MDGQNPAPVRKDDAYEYREKPPTNWCRILSIQSIAPSAKVEPSTWPAGKYTLGACKAERYLLNRYLTLGVGYSSRNKTISQGKNNSGHYLSEFEEASSLEQTLCETSEGSQFNKTRGSWKQEIRATNIDELKGNGRKTTRAFEEITPFRRVQNKSTAIPKKKNSGVSCIRKSSLFPS